MEAVIEFLNNYKLLILASLGLIQVFLGVISLFFSFFLAHKKTGAGIKEYILEMLPALISEAEALFVDGKEKLSFVIAQMQSLICKNFNVFNATRFCSFIEKSVEKILSTPTKKGALYEKKN